MAEPCQCRRGFGQSRTSWSCPWQRKQFLTKPDGRMACRHWMQWVMSSAFHCPHVLFVHRLKVCWVLLLGRELGPLCGPGLSKKEVVAGDGVGLWTSIACVSVSCRVTFEVVVGGVVGPTPFRRASVKIEAAVRIVAFSTANGFDGGAESPPCFIVATIWRRAEAAWSRHLLAERRYVSTHCGERSSASSASMMRRREEMRDSVF
jgi:hypothetical protein